MLPTHIWGAPLDSDAPVILAIHGITANAHALKRLADTLGEFATVVAPDLRGRGLSSDMPGPFGIARHADDMLGLLDHLGIESVTALGHSMGGFVAAMAATSAPERVNQVVLLDGGTPLPVPPGMDPQQMLEKTMGPTLERLDREFASFEDYLAFWRQHPAMTEIDDKYLIEYLWHDIDPEVTPVRSRISHDAVRQDGAELMSDPNVRAASGLVEQPLLLVTATRGIINQPQPRIPPARAAEFASGRPNVRIVEAADTNHFSVISHPLAVELIAREVSDLLHHGQVGTRAAGSAS
jgi:pimeloyl-ACP methyl ester carboxylesterase